MPIGRYKCCAALGLVVCAVGCAGNGQGLDQNGQPIGGGSGGTPGTLTADFQSIQDNVFTPICSKCHIGASAPEGLQLDAAHSYNLLVGVPSAENPSLLRVKPSDPDSSYMVLKIENAPGIQGGQMPLNETPLPQATIATIRQWITNGAPNAPAAAPAAAASAFAIQTTAPLDNTVMKAAPQRIVVTFNQEVDASLVNESTVSVQRMPQPPSNQESAMATGGAATSTGDATMPTGGATTVPVIGTLSEFNPSVLLITPAAPLGPGTYRVTIRGTGAGAVANLQATTLNADRSFEFTVELAR
jgi:methionine-rich copper-binding protein CopC